VRIDEDQYEGYQEGTAVAHDMVSPFQRFELLGVVLPEEGKIHIWLFSLALKALHWSKGRILIAIARFHNASAGTNLNSISKHQ